MKFIGKYVWIILLSICLVLCMALTSCGADNNPADTSSAANPVVEFVFSTGDKARFELYPAIAPITVNNFLRYVGEGFYTGTIIHRVESVVVQGGGYTMDADGLHEKATHAPIKGEFSSNGVKNNLSHKAGALSMARTEDPNSATAQFFFCVVDMSSIWDDNYAAFGMALDDETLATIKKLSAVQTYAYPYNTFPVQTISIVSVKVIEK